MSWNIVLTDKNGEQVLPVTTSENVFTGAGVTLKETLENMAGGGGSVVVDTELSDTSTNPVQNKVVKAKFDEVFQSVSNGKSAIASAITDKGIETDAEATFETMAKNILSIKEKFVTNAFIVLNDSLPLIDGAILQIQSLVKLGNTISLDMVDTNLNATSISRNDDYSFNLVCNLSNFEGDTKEINTLPGFFFDSELSSFNDITSLSGVDMSSLEWNTADELICVLGGRYWYKDNDGFAIGGYYKSGTWYYPVLLSTNREATILRTDFTSTPIEQDNTISYNGVTYYCNTGSSYGMQASSSQGRGVLINDIPAVASGMAEGKSWQQALLDFYYGLA